VRTYPLGEPLSPGSYATVEMMTPLWRSPVRLSKRTWEDDRKRPFDWLDGRTNVFIIATQKKHGVWWSFVSWGCIFGWIINEKGMVVC